MIDVQNVRKEFDGFAALGGYPYCTQRRGVRPGGSQRRGEIHFDPPHYRYLPSGCRRDHSRRGGGFRESFRQSAHRFDSGRLVLFSPVRCAGYDAFYRGFYPKFNMERYEKFKEVFSIDEKRTIRRLSKGMQKQVAFWLAMCTMPDYLVLDEPVDGLDPVMRRQVWSLILNDVAERGTTVLVSSHNLRELEDVCDHVGIMDHGKVLLQRSLEELQGGTVKVQMVPSGEDVALPEELEILHRSATGRVQTLIVRGSAEEVTARLSVLQPLLLEALPLSLEEIFIYELGGVDYAVKDIVL